ncbi:MAG: aminotransferase class I/II-fold pyridoxal phosphate-dependent enzyme [Alsobacter sp.]
MSSDPPQASAQAELQALASSIAAAPGPVAAIDPPAGGIAGERPVLVASATASSRAARFDTAFETLPAYRNIARQRALAGMLGVDAPYYRVHDTRAGATATIEGRACINFASYDYLGLNGHAAITKAVARAAREWGTSVSGSRMTAGERALHRELERALASLYDSEDCALFVSGHATAVSTIAALVGPNDLVLMDAFVHNCVQVGAQLSGAARRSFPHNDHRALADMLERERDRFKRVLIVTEGLFSMDGDGADLSGLVALKSRFGCWLMVDDAHGLGVLGERGHGAGEHAGIDPRDVDIWMGTLSKSLVSCGGYVAGCRALVDMLKFTASGLVYSVGLPMPATAASLTALELMRREPERVARLRRNSRLLWHTARSSGFDTGLSWGFGIVPILVRNSADTVVLAERLLDRGVNAFPVVPPGVPENGARLRFFVSADHTPEQIRTAVAILSEELDSLMRRGGALGRFAGLTPLGGAASA